MWWLPYQLAVLSVLGATLLALLINLRAFRSLPRKFRRGESPMISVLVPARNEEHRIGPCASSLAAQDYPRFEILVLDDHSTDGTSALLGQHGFASGGERLRLIRGEPLPVGWTGKCWACDQLARHARGEYLLFTDADTVHRPESLSAAMAMALETRADLLSAWPRLITLTWSEKLIIPIIHLLAGAFYPHGVLAWLQARPGRGAGWPRAALRALGAANGQFLLFKADSYQRIGGHAAVRDHLVEDVALGRAITAHLGEGMRLLNCDGSAYVDCRMYTRLSEVWEGFTKNIRPVFENAPGAFFVVGSMQFCTFFAPFLLVLFPVPWRGLILAQIALIYAIRILLTARFRTSWLGCLLHPVGHFLGMLIGLNSWRLSARGEVSWKGRSYRVQPR